jgi:ATP-binding protein involved in chromosome partitioning
MLTEQAVMHVLSGINDPELKKPLTELDMVRYVKINGGKVDVGITLTVPGCPLKAKITDDVTSGIMLIPGVEAVNVQFDVMTEEQRMRLREKLGMGSAKPGKEASIVKYAKRFIAVSSGKGGVGKSTVTANLAAALAKMGKKVGLSIPRMLGLSGQPTVIDDKMVPLRRGDNLQVVSMGFFIDEDEPVIWRGPLLHKAINQFINDVIWDELDYLFLDLPPGTGDVTLTIAQSIPSAELLVVTTPQATATHVAGRVAKMAERTNLKVIGVIENMAYYETDGRRDYIFGKDGGKDLAKSLGVELLGEIPLLTAIREGSDSGHPVSIEGTEKEMAIFAAIARKLEGMAQR